MVYTYTPGRKWTVVEGAIPRRRPWKDIGCPLIIYRSRDESALGQEECKIPAGVGPGLEGKYVGNDDDSGWIFYYEVEGAGVVQPLMWAKLQGWWWRWYLYIAWWWSRYHNWCRWTVAIWPSSRWHRGDGEGQALARGWCLVCDGGQGWDQVEG